MAAPVPRLPLLTTAEVAEYASVCRDTVAAWISTGIMVRGMRVRLQARKIGGRWRIKRRWLRAFLESQFQRTAPALFADPAARERERQAAAAWAEFRRRAGVRT